MTERHSCWSITINNPTDDEVKVDNPGWKLEGQYEVGKEGTRHFQGYLKTPQCRFTAVKKAFPRAHIEPARNAQALKKYVHKDETRVDVYTPGAIPTIFEYQEEVAKAWSNDEWAKLSENVLEEKIDDSAMVYLDVLVKRDIEAGKRGCEWIAINPMWRSSWRKFWRSIIKRRDGVISKATHETASQGQHEGDSTHDGCEDNSAGEESSESPDRDEIQA